MIQTLKNYYHFLQSALAAYYFRHPARQMTIIGVTGTDGKTTTAHLIFHILRTAGLPTGIISTIGAEIGSKKLDTGFHVTTPNAFAVQSFIKTAREEHLTHLVLEVTSHALDQHRVKHVPFTIGVLTNVTHEHLDYHKTLERYLQTKVLLLRHAKTAILNKDDSSYPLVVKSLQSTYDGKIVTYGMNNADITRKTIPFKSHLKGDYNTLNILASIAVAKALGIKDSKIKKAIETFSLPVGRYEVVYSKAFTVIVDFAHTPNALQQLLLSIRKDMAANGRLIHVFGAAGERDRTKRPAMGRISQKIADIIVLTSEDPRHEKVETIIDEIKSGMAKTQKQVISSPDRKMAITTAISLAGKGDVIVITGKGHEQSMHMDSGEVAWSDREVIISLLQK